MLGAVKVERRFPSLTSLWLGIQGVVEPVVLVVVVQVSQSYVAVLTQPYSLRRLSRVARHHCTLFSSTTVPHRRRRRLQRAGSLGEAAGHRGGRVNTDPHSFVVQGGTRAGCARSR